MDHAEFLVINDAGRKDTLTFNIFVNSLNYHSNQVKPSGIHTTEFTKPGINAIPFSGTMKFILPAYIKLLCVYDARGKMVGKFTPIISNSKSTVFWPTGSKIPAGKYFAKAFYGRNSIEKPFLRMR
jgi:hypothetical protein